jgi:SAM-dependent methyltransferase
LRTYNIDLLDFVTDNFRMSERIRVLDIGIGRGGNYIRRDPESVLRVGLDFDPDGRMLEMLKDEYNIPLVSADASGEKAFLTFLGNSFDHIDIFFPFNELLYGLCESDLIWEEIRRILKDSGDMTILCDTACLGTTGIEVRGKSVLMDYPERAIWQQAKKNGFSIDSFYEMEAAETRTYETQFAQFIANWQEEVFPHRAYRLDISTGKRPV